MSEISTKVVRETGRELIQTSTQKDAYGFAYHRLAPMQHAEAPEPQRERTREKWVQIGRALCVWFDNYRHTQGELLLISFKENEP
jgi:hypothetical protein